MPVIFNDAVQGEMYYFPGMGKRATVIRVYGKRIRQHVTISTEDTCIEVTYSANTWFAVTLNEQVKYEASPGDGPQFLGLDKVMSKIGGNQVKQVKRRAVKPMVVRRRKKSQVVIKVKDTRPLPEIPGPPPPRPSQGVWSVPTWTISDA